MDSIVRIGFAVLLGVALCYVRQGLRHSKSHDALERLFRFECFIALFLLACWVYFH